VQAAVAAHGARQVVPAVEAREARVVAEGLARLDEAVRVGAAGRAGAAAAGGLDLAEARTAVDADAVEADGVREDRADALYNTTRPLAPPYSLHTVLLKVE
jgi:hypothetical protein